MAPTGSGRSKIVLENVHVEANANVGVRIDMSGTTGGNVSISMEASHVVGGFNGVSVNAPGAGTAAVMLVRSEIANNFGAGLSANGANAVVRVSDTSIFGNQSGVAATNGATVGSYGDNRLDGNPASGAPNNGAFNAALPKQ